MTTEAYNKIINTMTLWAGVRVFYMRPYKSYSENEIFFKTLPLRVPLSINQTNIVMMTKEGSIKIVNSITPGAGVLMLFRA